MDGYAKLGLIEAVAAARVVVTTNAVNTQTKSRAKGNAPAPTSTAESSAKQ